MNIHVVIPAGGSGTRFGAKKQFLEWNGKTLLAHVVSHLMVLHPTTLVLAVPQEDVQAVQTEYGERVRVVAGGRSRAESVACGVAALQGSDSDVVLIHDAARPFVAEDLLERLIEGTLQFGACVPVLPVADTIKVVREDGLVAETLLRSKLRAVQTPQGFRLGLLRYAHQTLDLMDPQFTDEASLMEAIDRPVFTVEGDPRTHKITTPLDLQWLQLLNLQAKQA